MLVYIAIIFVVFSLSFSLNNQNSEVMLLKYNGKINSYKLKIIIIAVILIFFAGFRYNVGADYIQYALNFKAYCNQTLALNGEPGIRIVSRIASKIYNESSAMFFCMSLITVGLCIFTIAKNSPYFIISILLYIFLGCWHESFNSVRQSAAAAILFFGHKYIKERDFKKWLLFCFIGYLFHTSAIVFIPIYFLPQNKKINLKTVSIFIIIGFFAAMFYDKAWEFIGFIQNKEFVIDLYSTNSISIFRILVAWTPILFYMINFKNREIISSKKADFNFYAFMSLLSATVILASRNSTYLGRLVIYLDIYNVLFWAYMLNQFSIKKLNTRIWTIIIMACYFLYYLKEVTGPYLIHYIWIFGR